MRVSLNGDISSLRALGPGGGQISRVVHVPARAAFGVFAEKYGFVQEGHTFLEQTTKHGFVQDGHTHIYIYIYIQCIYNVYALLRCDKIIQKDIKHAHAHTHIYIYIYICIIYIHTYTPQFKGHHNCTPGR